MGIILNPSLNWDAHESTILKRVNFMLYCLRLHKRALKFDLRKHLVESPVFPHFDYACSVYHDLYQMQDDELQRALNTCVRFVWGPIGWHDHITPYRLELGWLSANYRREYLLGSLAYSTIVHGVPT